MRYLQNLAIAAVCGVATLTVLGCASTPERKLEFPPSAMRASGNAKVSYVVQEPGTVSVVDNSDNSIVVSSNVSSGDTVTVDPDQNIVTVNAMSVSSNRLHRGNNHSIYFIPKGSGDMHSPM